MNPLTLSLRRNLPARLSLLGALWLAGCGDSEPNGSAGGGAAPVAGSATQGTTAGTNASGGDGGGGASNPGTSGSGSGGSSASGSGSGGGGASSAGGEQGMTAGAGGAAGSAGEAGTGGSGGSADVSKLDKFSFFVTSQKAMVRLSKSDDGFGGDLRYGTESGLEGADKICTEIAETSMPGSGAKQWRAFLSTEHGGPNDGPIHAKDRIGQGPWYDRVGRLVAMNLQNLLKNRPEGADPAIKEDLPNEDGVPNHRPDPTKPADDNHHTLTGSKADGTWYGKDPFGISSTCLDWTTKSRDNRNVTGRPRIGFMWSIQNRTNWISGQDEGGCGAGITGVGTVNGGSDPNNPIVGSGGGYGAIYCFALTP